MYKRMLIPLDGSKLSEVSLAYAKELVGRLDIDVVLLHVCAEEEQQSIPMQQAYVEHAAERIISQSEEVWKNLVDEQENRVIRAEALVAVGSAADEILRCAHEKQVDLILMATHGRSGLRRWVLGSVADKVLRASSIPVLLVRADVPEEVVNEKWPCRRFLVLLDGSELAEAVLPHVDAMAKQRGHELTDVVLLRVLEPLSTPTLSTPDMSDEWGQAVEEHISGSQQEIKEYLSEVAGRLKAAGVEVSTEMLEGIPSEEIVAYASDDPFNLIFMATHGRSGVSRWALGSVAEKILTGVSSPVFLVRPPQAHGESLIPPFVSAFKSLGPI